MQDLHVQETQKISPVRELCLPPSPRRLLQGSISLEYIAPLRSWGGGGRKTDTCIVSETQVKF